MLNRLGEILISRKLISKEQLDYAMREQERSGELIGKILLKAGMISETDLLLALSEQLGIPSKDLKDITVPPELIKVVPAKFVWHYKFIPLKLEGDLLHIVTSTPQNTAMTDELRLHLGYNISPAYASEEDIQEAIRRYYGIGGETVGKIMGETQSQELKIKRAEEGVTDLEKMAEDASVIKLVNQLLLDAIKDRATDIHIEPYRDKVRIRYRVDGILYDTPIPEDIKYLLPAMISRIKIISGLDIVERRQPQDGRARVKVGEKEIDLRISVIPSINGENIVIRILPTHMLLNLEEVGIEARDFVLIEKLIHKPFGIIFLTGPTGSGKTTTLYAALSKLNNAKVKIITIEDPVEYELTGVTQIQVNPKVNLTFANALRSILRHDPDIMMVGEVRDHETAELAIRVALTGHLVFSTLHTNDAASAVTRLVDMGIEPFLVASSVVAFIAQRLVRTICPQCKMKDDTVLKDSRVEENAIRIDRRNKNLDGDIYRGTGCEACKFTGFKGRTTIYEIMPVSDEVRELILRKADATEIKRRAQDLGMRSLRECGWEKIRQGITTADEVVRVTELE